LSLNKIKKIIKEETRTSVKLTNQHSDQFCSFGAHQLWVGFKPWSKESANPPTTAPPSLTLE